MSIGLVLSNPQEAASAPPTAPKPTVPSELNAMTRLSNGVSSALFTFWLAGGVALWGLRRERSGLAALVREHELVRAQAQRREAELQLSVLAAQVEPHFLFNTLAGVRSAIATDPTRASDMIDHLVDYLRAAIPRLRSSGGSEATLGGQLEIVRAYLALMAARMPRLSFTIEAAPELRAAPCPSLMLISLAENAVKHGVEPSAEGAQLRISTLRRGSTVVIKVTNTTPAGSGERGHGLALANVRERLVLLHDVQASFRCAFKDGVFQVRLEIPA